MTPEERESRTATLFHEALTRAADQRLAFLAQACAGDLLLLRRVKELLDADAVVESCAQSLGPSQKPTALALDPDTLIALGERYEEVTVIGSGGMGIVFRARDREIDKVVALKVLHPFLANDEGMIERFRKEIRFALDITHKNVCRTYGLERLNGTLFIAMEYVDGETMRSLLDRVQGVSLRQGLLWSLEICDALAVAHGKRIVHRDLKPQNIMIDRDGHIKVMDFGIARSLEATPQASGTIIGTPRYMSPEQALGGSAEPTSDIYSLGLVLYELFTGVRPDPVRWAAPGAVSPYLPGYLDRAICKCLENDPTNRFQSTNELSLALTKDQSCSTVKSKEPGEEVQFVSLKDRDVAGWAQSNELGARLQSPDVIAGAQNRYLQGGAAAPIVTAAPKHRSRLQLLGRDALRAFIVFVVFIGLHLYLETRSFGEHLRSLEYGILHQALTSESGAAGPLRPNDRGLPVVIDISPFRQDKSQPTDRNRLEELIDTLVRMNAAAIGVDIDFSPDDQGRFITPRDPQLFGKWQQYGNVRVGVFRREGDRPSRWLGHPDFRRLAAGIMLPEGNAQRAYYFNSPVHSISFDDYLPQMPAALHSILQRSAGSSPAAKVPRIRETYFDEAIVLGDYPIDYSFVDQIQRIPYGNKGDLDHWKEQIDRRVVLVGDLQDAEDSRCSGVRREPVPGVLIQASALATLNHGLLWQIDDRGTFLCDLGLFFLVIAVVGTGRLVQVSVPHLKSVSPRSLDIVSFQCAACSILVLAIIFIGITHFFWPDFLWIATGFFLYPYLAEIMTIFWNGARGFFVAATARGISDAH